MRLTDFILPVAKPLELSLVGLDYKTHEFAGKLLGYQKGKNVLVALDTKPGQVLLHAGLSVKVTIRLATGVLRFDSEIELVNESPFTYLHLDFPYGVEFDEIRGSVRTPVDTPVEIYAYTGLGMTSAPITGHMLDVSATGARLVVEKELTNMVTKISVGVMLERDGFKRDMTLMAEVQGKNERSKFYPECSFGYGIKFIELDSVDQLFLKAFC